MKVLHIYKSYYPESVGGAEKVIDLLAESTKDMGIESSVLTINSSKTAYNDQRATHTVHYFPKTVAISSCPMSIPMFFSFKELVKDFDLLHYHFPWPYGDFLHVTLGVDKPAVITYHSDIVKQKVLNVIYNPLMKKFLNKAKALVATSDNYIASSPVLQEYKNKTTAIPIGISADFYPKVSETAKNKWRDKVGENFFLFVGVLRYYKGLEYLLEAVKGTDIRLVIAGVGPEEKKLKHFAKKENLSNVQFVGRVSEDDKVALLDLCQSVVIPSCYRSEAFCISLLEGLMFGKPLISTEISTGTSFVNQDGKTGIVVPPKDPAALKEALLSIRDNDALRAEFVKNTRTHYENNFTVDKMAKAYADIYQQVLSESNDEQ